MEKLYYRLLLLSLHYFAAFAFCDYALENQLELNYDECPSKHYYCYSGYPQPTEVSFFTCFNTEIWEIQESLDQYNRGYTYIDLQNSIIPTLSPDGYSWNNVRKLRIEETNTNEIIPGFFNNFDELRELCITKNKIKTISDGVFSSLLKLYTLNLTENFIETVTQHSLSGLFNLGVLDLSKNKITSLSVNVFAHQDYLVHVDISHNMLLTVDTIFDKVFLNTINISHNFLAEFDFNQLVNSAIYNIDLSNNEIDRITDMDLNIVKISLAYNNISVLPKISNIKSFNISYNKIQGVDDNMLSETLQSLDITGNNISVLSNHIFTNLTDLEYLYFGHNNLSLIQIDSLHNLHNLKHLDLSFNRIRQIPFGFFNDLNKLTFLDLSDNNMDLDFHTLSTLKSLETFKFKNNKVENFDSDILLSRFQFLKSITLSDNSWNCTTLASIVHKLQLKNINLTPGHNRNVSNILGISCKDNVDLKEDTIIIERNDGAPKYDEFYPLAVNIDNIFRNTSFFKYLQMIADNKSLDFSQNESVSKFVQNLNDYVANISNSLINMQEYNNKSMGYMAKIFNETILNFNKSVVKTDSAYLPDWSEKFNQTLIDLIKNIISGQNEQFNKISTNQTAKMAKNVGWSEINQTLINLTNSFNEISNNMKLSFNSVSVDKNMESKALISEKHEATQTSNNSLIFINIFLAMILCCLIFSAYRKFLKEKLIKSSTQEQVQLM